MIVVRLMGGLGNQMFQYATAKALAIRNNTILKVDTSLLEANKKRAHEIYTHRDLDLEIFNLELVQPSQKEIEYYNGKTYPNVIGKIYNKIVSWVRKRNLVMEKTRAFDPEVIKLSDNKCLVGGWQSELYFKDHGSEIRKAFVFRGPIKDISKELLNEIKTQHSICVNVRRGDYVTSPIYSKDIGALPADYYNQGIALLEKKIRDAKIFVFSDDIQWCKDNLHANVPLQFIEHEHAGEKFGNYLQLMTQCKHFVIPNSTFGWWAAWLGNDEDKLVVAPEKWTLNLDIRPHDILPKNWIVL